MKIIINIIILGSIFANVFSVGGDLITVMVITKYLIIFIIPVAFVYYWVMCIYLRASREIQRMQSTSQSPVLTFMSESSNGVSIIRAHGDTTTDRFIRKNEKLIDANSTMTYLAAAVSSWYYHH